MGLLAFARLRPGVSAWTWLCFAVVSGIAFVVGGGHALDGRWSIGGRLATVAYAMAFVSVVASLLATAREHIRTERESPR
jgi:hypothetical protein